MACLSGLAAPAPAVMDIADRGPVLNAGNFTMRITNIGVVGNAFFDPGLSFDPSFEYPRGSGQEGLGHAELWVGARTAEGDLRVSGGPMLEWRPSLDPDDRVRTAWAGEPGRRRGVDDDGDGATDEERLNGRDDDGDGESDEDLGVPAQQLLAAEYRDDEPAAINYGYSTGERHQPLGLEVYQEAYAWTARGYETIAGLKFRITNRSGRELRDVRLGLYCDFDSRLAGSPGGHVDDRFHVVSFEQLFNNGVARVNGGGVVYRRECLVRTRGDVPAVGDRRTGAGLPLSAVVPLGHTTDPFALLTNTAFPGVREVHALTRAPARDTTFGYRVYAADAPPRLGGPPVLDADRYDALAGNYPSARLDYEGDVAVLIACGPFPRLGPGEAVEFAVAFVAASDQEKLAAAMGGAHYLYRGIDRNLLPDQLSINYSVGETGINGHEVCLEPPPGYTFNYDPHCPEKFVTTLKFECEEKLCDGQCCPPLGLTTHEVAYRPGHCVWTDLDCDLCTGHTGEDLDLRWFDPATAPPAPAYRAVRGDHRVTVEWDNLPEILLAARVAGAEGFQFSGYRLYRLSDWTRRSTLPPAENFQLLAAFGLDTLQHERSLASVTDSTLDYDRIAYGARHYPIGRYRLVDEEVLNGFDYVYVVTTVAERRTTQGGNVFIERLESPLVSSMDSVVVPQVSARERAGGVWVVPNPYRAHAAWDRPPVPGDPFGRHLDFFGLPRARATIRIYTVAGDFVAQIDHDGSDGDGQASWNLISRNGQEVESGIYLFTVDSAMGHETGRFVLIR